MPDPCFVTQQLRAYHQKLAQEQRAREKEREEVTTLVCSTIDPEDIVQLLDPHDLCERLAAAFVKNRDDPTEFRVAVEEIFLSELARGINQFVDNVSDKSID